MKNTINIYIGGKVSTAGQLILTNWLSVRMHHIAKEYDLICNTFLPQYIVKNEHDVNSIFAENFKGLKKANLYFGVIDHEGQGTLIESMWWAYNKKEPIVLLLTDKNEKGFSPIWDFLEDKKERFLFIHSKYLFKMKDLEADNPSMVDDSSVFFNLMSETLDSQIREALEWYLSYSGENTSKKRKAAVV